MTTFSSIQNNKPKSDIKKEDWLTLKEGSNRIRIVSEFEQIKNHYIDNGSLRGYFVCQGIDCPACKTGNIAKNSYICYAIDRNDNKIKIFKYSASIHKELLTLCSNPDYAFEYLPPYDIIIDRTGQKLQTRYKVTPARQDTPLTEAETEELSRKEEISELIKKMKEFDAKRLNELDVVSLDDIPL